jgi:hypothetical protein
MTTNLVDGELIAALTIAAAFTLALLAITAYAIWTAIGIHRQKASLRRMNGNQLPETEPHDDH